MDLLPLGLVVCAAFLHSWWNLLTKNSHDKLAFVWWFLGVAALLYLPLFLYLASSSTIPAEGWGYILASAPFQIIYFILLSASYQRGEFSVVYPLARGSAPLFVAPLASLLLAERLSPYGILGIGLVALGIYVVHFGPALFSGLSTLRKPSARGASRMAILAGISISFYSVIDKVGVSKVHPFLYLYLTQLFSLVALTPYMFLLKREVLGQEWALSRGRIAAVAFMSVLAYLLVLFAMTLSKVSYVVAAREVSIVFSPILGTWLLKERYGGTKLLGSSIIVLGIIFLSIAR